MLSSKSFWQPPEQLLDNLYVDHALEREWRAWKLLQWGSRAEIAPFDEVLAVQGFYTRVQKERSDEALDAFDQEMRKPLGLSELDAFRILEARGVFSQDDYYSPSKAANGFYRQRLKQLNAEVNQKRSGRDCPELDGSSGGILRQGISDSDQGRAETARPRRRQRERRRGSASR